MLHGRGPHPAGGAGFDEHGDWLVQAVPHLLHGGPHDGASNPTLVPALPGEHGGTMLRTLVKSLFWGFIFSSLKGLSRPLYRAAPLARD